MWDIEASQTSSISHKESTALTMHEKPVPRARDQVRHMGMNLCACCPCPVRARLRHARRRMGGTGSRGSAGCASMRPLTYAGEPTALWPAPRRGRAARP